MIKKVFLLSIALILAGLTAKAHDIRYAINTLNVEEVKFLLKHQPLFKEQKETLLRDIQAIVKECKEKSFFTSKLDLIRAVFGGMLALGGSVLVKMTFGDAFINQEEWEKKWRNPKLKKDLEIDYQNNREDLIRFRRFNKIIGSLGASATILGCWLIWKGWTLQFAKGNLEHAKEIEKLIESMPQS